MIRLFVNGTLMRGLALHSNLDGATFVGERWTTPRYRIHTIRDDYPGMYEVDTGGVRVAGELYELSEGMCDDVLAGEPPGLYLGDVVLDGGDQVKGVLCPQDQARRHRDISEYGSWRRYMDDRADEAEEAGDHV